MAKVDSVTYIVCDFCKSSQTRDSKRDHWFIVKTKEGKLMDCCLPCGHDLNNQLIQLDIKHTFICKEYSDNPGNGSIEIF